MTYRECECGRRVPYSEPIYRLEKVTGSFVETRTLCARCLLGVLREAVK